MQLFPMVVWDGTSDKGNLFDGLINRRKMVNLSQAASEYLLGLHCERAESIFFHAVAVLHSPFYRGENTTALHKTGRIFRFRRIGRPWNHQRCLASKSRRC